MVSVFVFVTSSMMAMPAFAEVVCTTQYAAITDFKNVRPFPPNYGEKLDALNKAAQECENERFMSITDCKVVKKDFDDTVKAAQKDCADWKLESSPEAGQIACSGSAEKCECAGSKIPKTERLHKDSVCYGVKDEDLKYCPARSEDASERIAKKIEKGNDRIDKLKDRIRALEDEGDKADNNITDKAQQSKQALRRAEADHRQAVNEAQSALSQAQAQIYQQQNGIRDKIFTAQQSVVEAALKDSGAFTAWQEQDLKIELTCTAQATQAVGAMQSEAIAAIKTGTYNRGSQNDIFRQVGLTDRQSWQKQAALRKKWCMESEMTLGSKASNQRTYNETVKANAAAKKSANDQIALLNQQMDQLLTANGTCATNSANGAQIQTEACRARDEMLRKTAAAEAAYKSAKDDARDEAFNAGMAQNKSAQKKDKQLAGAKSDLIQAQEQLDKDVEKEKALDTYPNAGSRAGSARALNIDFEKLTDKAGALNRCCKISSTASSTRQADRDFGQDATCGSVEKYLQARKINTSLSLYSDRTTSPTPATTPSSGSTDTTTPQSGGAGR